MAKGFGSTKLDISRGNNAAPLSWEQDLRREESEELARKEQALRGFQKAREAYKDYQSYLESLPSWTESPWGKVKSPRWEGDNHVTDLASEWPDARWDSEKGPFCIIVPDVGDFEPYGG